MSSKKITFPFLATHSLTAEIKGVGSMTVPVMAVFQDGVTRLFDSDEAEAGTLPEWRVATIIDSTSPLIAPPAKIQRNRKDAKTATLVRISEVFAFELKDGELISSKAPLPVTSPTIVLDEQQEDVAAILDTTTHTDTDTHTEPTTVELDLAAKAAADAKAAKVAAAVAKKAAKDADKAAKKAVKDAAKAAKSAGKVHRAGSVQGMNIDELRAEFTAKTKQPAPSTSIHYMRKMVLWARRGKVDFKRRSTKVPTMTLSLADAQHLLAGAKSPEGLEVAGRIAAFVKENTPAAQEQVAA